jgi:hypothetical protein
MQEDLGLSMTVWQVCHGGIHGLTLISKNITAREEGGSSIVLANGSDTTRPTTSMMQTAIGAHPPIFANSLRVLESREKGAANKRSEKTKEQKKKVFGRWWLVVR